MKDIKLYLSIFLVSLFSIMVSCSNDSVSDKKEIVVETANDVNESELLLDFVSKSGDFINTKKAPTIIKAADVNDNLDKYLVLDIRSQSAYESGHIDGSIQVTAKDLLNYMSSEANSGNYEKVVIACYSGQTAAYYTSLLHLLGYGNVYSLKWGMASWSKKIEPNKWVNGVSNKYASILETKGNSKGKKGAFPTISTEKSNVYEIMKARVKIVAEEGYKGGSIKIDKLMEEKDKYYVINYWPMDLYILGHLPGSIQYEPKKSLIADRALASLPTDKPIAIYCYTGQHSAFVAAYLRVLGYDAYTLSYGANGFMNGKMKNEIGHAFVATTEINDYSLVMGENPSNKKVVKQVTSEKNNTVKKIIPKKKKRVEEEGGC